MRLMLLLMALSILLLLILDDQPDLQSPSQITVDELPPMHQTTPVQK